MTSIDISAASFRRHVPSEKVVVKYAICVWNYIFWTVIRLDRCTISHSWKRNSAIIRDGCLECNYCGAGVTTDNLSEDQDVLSIHDSISGSCSSRSYSILSDVLDTDNVFFNQAPDGILEPNEETEKRRWEAAKPAPLSNKPVRGTAKPQVKDKSKKELQEENTRLKLFDKCKDCHSNEAVAMGYPCKHLELCRTCAGKTQKCPVCHTNIMEI